MATGERWEANVRGSIAFLTRISYSQKLFMLINRDAALDIIDVQRGFVDIFQREI